MVAESEEEKFSLGGKCERRPWLVLKMPVARQAKHETCVRGMAMVLSACCFTPSQCSQLAGRERLRPLPFSPRVAGPESRPSTEFTLSALADWYRIFHETPRTENKNRISHENESDLSLASHVVLY
jgi:hypothetical protein